MKNLCFVLFWIASTLCAQKMSITGTTYDGLTQRALARCVVSLKDAIADTLLVQAQTALQEERIEENGNQVAYLNAQMGARFVLQLSVPIAPQGYVLIIEKDKYERIERKISAESLQKGRLDVGDFYLFPKHKEQTLGEAVISNFHVTHWLSVSRCATSYTKRIIYTPLLTNSLAPRSMPTLCLATPCCPWSI